MFFVRRVVLARPGTSEVLLGSLGFSWALLGRNHTPVVGDILGSLGLSSGYLGLSWVVLRSLVFSWALLGFLGISCVLLGTLGFSWVLFGSLGFSWILLDRNPTPVVGICFTVVSTSIRQNIFCIGLHSNA